jgi:hypothetical protein
MLGPCATLLASSPAINRAYPAAGTIPPNGSVALTVTFTPAPEPSSKGFGHSLAREAGKAARAFEYLVSLDFAGLGRSVQIPIRGSAAPPVLEVTPQVRAAIRPLKLPGAVRCYYNPSPSPKLPRPTHNVPARQVLHFGEVDSYSWADQMLEVANQSAGLPLAWRAPKAHPYYVLEPPGGSLAPGEKAQVLARYLPRALGHHRALLPLQVGSGWQRRSPLVWLGSGAQRAALPCTLLMMMDLIVLFAAGGGQAGPDPAGAQDRGAGLL